eukprot:CAMPEP_0116544526 /NCGR_PEP_ID=MMETSP0397-20121206/2164_1 /TAXON_ID=216820 /ORGANISM="Cyclophora tenuis, Strain ECT3854" /LENGTH=328 /DNA_ID=CAMNT_0004068743 /DNA_START=40 /DNA_END=1026 /DNA_ORIENTATION=-
MTTKLYPEIVFETPDDGGDEEIDAACEEIHTACQGWGTDEGGLIDALASKSPEMRCKIYYRYKAMFEKDLEDVMKSECGSGDFGLALQYLAVPPNLSEAMMLKRAMAGFGTKERIVWPILCGRDNEEIVKLKETYFAAFDNDLGVQLSGELGGDFERLIFHCIQGSELEYDPDVFTDEKAEEDCNTFYDAGQGQWGTDEKSLFHIIATSPPEHLEKVNELYIEKHERTLISALEKELGGDVEKGSMHCVGMKIKPEETVAKLIKSTCAGFGTDELGLTCAIIRYQSILPQVNEMHQELFEKTIQERIESETGGNYKRLLLAIVDNACA